MGLSRTKGTALYEATLPEVFLRRRIVVKNRKIHKVVPTPIFKILKNRHEIIIRQSGLPKPKLDIQLDFTPVTQTFTAVV
ncbi:TPA: hypothetical protein DIS61_01090 [Patescibacteria group bacterium]|nr:hypothetical protein [Patescibacteria group bacterium]